MFCGPVVLNLNEFPPNAVLPDAVLFCRANLPTAVFRTPTALLQRAPEPIATLLSPVVLDNKALWP